MCTVESNDRKILNIKNILVNLSGHTIYLCNSEGKEIKILKTHENEDVPKTGIKHTNQNHQTST